MSLMFDFQTAHSLPSHIDTLYTHEEGALQTKLTGEACSHSSFHDRP